jgi:dinuclear metal center YbgI/SA1388 family protein
MSVTVSEVNSAVESLWPLTGSESWDAPGLLSGDPSTIVSAIHLAVDAVADTVAEAITLNADVLLVHHPLLLRGVTSVAADRYKGSIIAKLIKADCALIAAHTNADVVETGTSAVFAAALSLQDVAPIVVSASNSTRGLCRVGRLPQAITLGEFAGQLAALLPATATGIRVSGAFDQLIESVALCGGAGDSLLEQPLVRSADVYVTSDLRHHPASESRENSLVSGGPALIDVSHWASEWLWLDIAAVELRAALPGVLVTVSDLRTDPWDFVVVQ